MLEFQSSSDPDMAVRILAYAGLVHQQSVRTGTLDAHGALPPVLPIVLYNGESRWTAAAEAGELVAAVDAALARYQPSQRYLLLDEGALGDEDLPPDNRMSALVALENSASVEELSGVLREVFTRFGGPEDEGLRGALYEWARHSPMTGRGEARWQRCRRHEHGSGERGCFGRGVSRASSWEWREASPKAGWTCCGIWRCASSGRRWSNGSPRCSMVWTTPSSSRRLVTGSSSAMRPMPCSSGWSGCGAAARTVGHGTNTKAQSVPVRGPSRRMKGAWPVLP